MARDDPDRSSSGRTLDDLFQVLVHTRRKSPAVARKEILDRLQLDELPIDLHVRGGTQKTYPLRPATKEELQKGAPIGEADGVVLDRYHLYETAPPEGIIERAPYTAWGRFFHLSIHGEQLVIEPDCALDYPWDAYSFIIANWSLVAELWPPLVSVDIAAPTALVQSVAELEPQRLQRLIFDSIVRRLHPRGVPEKLSTGAVERQVANAWADECKVLGVKLSDAPIPHRSTIHRYLGRGLG
jgi:hypothetical protein